MLTDPKSESGNAKRRKLDDEELDSGDDEGRRDRLEDGDMDGYVNDEEEQGEMRSQNVADIRLARHPIPCPSDGEVSPYPCAQIYQGHIGQLTVNTAIPVPNAQAARYRAETVPSQYLPTPHN